MILAIKSCPQFLNFQLDTQPLSDTQLLQKCLKRVLFAMYAE